MQIQSLFLAALLAAGTAQAAIDIGASGNGELFFNIWDGTQSYSFDLNKTIDTFQSDLAGAGDLNLSWSLDGYAGFVAGVADPNALQWNIVATDTSGARRILTTYTPPEDPTPITASNGRSVAGALQIKAQNINLGLIGDAGTFAVSDAGYTGNPSTTWLQLGFNSFGDLTNNSHATGLGFMRVDCNSLGDSGCGLNEYLDGGNPVNAWLDSGTGTLYLGYTAPVPEADSILLVVAGLGVLGWLYRRHGGSAVGSGASQT